MTKRRRRNLSDNNLTHALEYAKNNWPLFPIHAPNPKTQKCSCQNPACTSQGKHPRTRRGFKDATTNEDQIRDWWGKWPDANIGIPTGKKFGFMVLDVDEGGDEQLINHKLPATVESITGNGRHLFFACPEKKIKSRSKIMPGLDIRGDGGYIIAPPSLHLSGKRYTWKSGNNPTKFEIVKLPICPQWIVDAANKPSVTAVKKIKLEDKIPEGKRNDTLFRYACSLRNRGINKEEIGDCVMGRNEKQCQPPLDDAEVDIIVKSAWGYKQDDDVTVKKILDQIKDYEEIFMAKESYCEHLQYLLIDDKKVMPMPEHIPKGFADIFEDKKVVIVSPKAGIESTKMVVSEIKEGTSCLNVIDFPIDGKVEFYQEGRRTALTLRVSREILNRKFYNAVDVSTKTLHKFLDKMVMPLSQFEKQKLPRRRTLLQPWLNESDIVLIAGDPGVGKTWLAMEICAAIQNDRPAMSGFWKVVNPARCLFVDGEMHWKDIVRMGSFLDMKGVDILSRTVLDHREITPPLNLADHKVRDLLFKHIIKKKYKVVVLDNIYSLFVGLDMDRATDWQAANQWFLKLRSANVCVIILHHTNKAGDQIGTKSRIFNVNTFLMLKGIKPKKINEKGEAIVSFKIDVGKQRMKGIGFGTNTFTCDDGIWDVTESKADESRKSKADYIMALLINEDLSQKDISEILDCSESYVTQTKKKAQSLNYLDDYGNPTQEGFKFSQGIDLSDFDKQKVLELT